MLRRPRAGADPRNLRLPFWLFNFEEIVDVFFGGRPGMEDEVEILSDVIPLAKGAYLQYRGADRHLAKKRDAKSAGLAADARFHKDGGSDRPAR